MMTESCFGTDSLDLRCKRRGGFATKAEGLRRSVVENQNLHLLTHPLKS